MRFRHRKTYEENLAEIRERYGPPDIEGVCDICGKEPNTEITWYFRGPSGLTGAKTTHRFCDDHGRELHNLVAPTFGWNHVDEPKSA